MTVQATVGERILAHLSFFARFRDEYECPLDVTQEGIGRSVGISRAHAALELKRLKAAGKVEERVAHVRGARTRRKVYFPTATGLERARRLRAHLKEAPVPMEGEVVPGTEAVVRLKERGLREVEAIQVLLAGETVRPPVPPSTPETGVFVGREAEVGRLRAWLAGDGAPLACILGVAGIGKTTLAARAAAESRGVAWHRVVPGETLPALHHEIAALLEGLGRPRLRAYLRNGGRDPVEVRGLLAEDLRDGLLVLDDVHESEEADAFVASLWRGNGSPKVLLTARRRPRCYDQGDVAARGGVVEIELGGLSRREAGALLRAQGVREEGIDGNRVYEATRGHPLALRLVAARGPEEGLRDLGRYVLETVLGDLDANLLAAVLQAAVHRKPFSPDALPSLAAFRALRRRGLVQGDGDGYVVHALIRDALVALVGADARRDAHGLAARHHAGRGDVLEAIFHHEAAGETAAVRSLLVDHGMALIEAGRAAEVLDHVRRLPPAADSEGLHLLRAAALEDLARYEEAGEAFRDLEETSSPRVAVQAAIHLGRIRSKLGRYDAATKAFRDAARRAREAEDAVGEATAWRGEAIVLRKMGRLEEADSLLREAIAVFRKAGEAEELGRSTMERGVVALERKRYGDAADAFRHVLAIVPPESRDAARALNNLGIAVAEEQDPEEAARLFEEAARTAEAIGELRAAAFAYSNAADNHLRRGDAAHAEAACRRALAFAARLQDPIVASAAHANLGSVFAHREDWQEAKAHLERSIDALRDLRSPRRLAARYREMARLYEAMGDPGRSRRWTTKAERLLSEGAPPRRA
jgi:ATP/maltotriose-dependent transcriptional regulator MalT